MRPGIKRLLTVFVLALCLFAAVSVCAQDEEMEAPHEGMGHGAELRRTPSGVFYEDAKLPIDPAVKSVLAVILVSLTLIAFTSIMIGIGRRGRTPRTENIAIWVHRINGWAFIILAVFITQYCLRILGVYGHLSEPAVVLHMAAAMVVVLIPIMKFVISRFFRDQNDLLPPMGITLFLLTWVAVWTVIIHYFRG